MRKFLFPASISFIVLIIITNSACDKKVGKLPVAPPVSVNICDSATYNLKIKKLIANSCGITDCHEANFPNGDFSNYDGLKGKVDNGSLKDRVFNSPDNPMPPVGNGGKLPADKLALIECWLNKGAKND